jgi:hypothetical protein
LLFRSAKPAAYLPDFTNNISFREVK